MYSVFPVDFVLTHFRSIQIPSTGSRAQPSRAESSSMVLCRFCRASTESALRKSMAMVECLGIPKMLMFFLIPQGSTNHPLNHPNIIQIYHGMFVEYGIWTYIYILYLGGGNSKIFLFLPLFLGKDEPMN